MATGLGVLAPGVAGLYNGNGSIVGVNTGTVPNGLHSAVPAPIGGQDSGALSTSDAGSGSIGGSGTNYDPQIGSLSAQAAALQGQLGNADTTLQSGLTNLQDQFNQQNSAANLNHSRALQDFQTTNQNDNLGHQQSIDNVNTKARTLANSVRQMIGNAGGSGSSAYQIAAPDAVQRQADLQSQDINNSFGQNMTALKQSQDREAEDYGGSNGILAHLADKYTQSKNGLQTGIAQQKQQINGQLADIAAQIAAYKGGGAGAAAAAASPYQANIAQEQQAIKDIASGYQSPFSSIAPVSVAAPTLRDYITGGKTNVATNPAGTDTTNTATYNPLASWLKTDNNNQYAF